MLVIISSLSNKSLLYLFMLFTYFYYRVYLSCLFNPLEQFEIISLINIKIYSPLIAYIDLTFTNMALSQILGIILIISLNILTTNYKKIFSNSWITSQESLYATIYSIVINQINKKKYFPFIYALFLFILINNLIGMVPYSFASTSHFILTFSISFTIVLGSTILGFEKNRLTFFSLFVPSGCPLALLPLLVLIEFI